MTSPDLSLCGICGGAAEFTDADPGANPVSYCSRDLPPHLQVRAAAGQLPLAPAGARVDTLQAEARELDIEGRSSMNKDELLAAVNEAKADDLVERNAAAEVIEHDLSVEDAEAKLLNEDAEELAADVTPPKAAKKSGPRRR